MAEPLVDLTPTASPIPRCCPTHPDWPTLVQHLVDDFPEASISEIVRFVGLARDAVQSMSVDEREMLDVGEVIARNQLMILTGQVMDAARLRPEHHHRRVT